MRRNRYFRCEWGSFFVGTGPQGEPSLYLRTMGGTGRGICLYGHYSPRLLRFALWMGMA